MGAPASVEAEKSVDREVVLSAMIGAHRLTGALLDTEMRGVRVGFALGDSWWLDEGGGGWHAIALVAQRHYWLGMDLSKVVKTMVGTVGLRQPRGRHVGALGFLPPEGLAAELGARIVDAFASTSGVLSVSLGFERAPEVDRAVQCLAAHIGGAPALIFRLRELPLDESAFSRP